LKLIDRVIPAEHRAQVVLSCDSAEDATEAVARILKPFGGHGRFQACRRNAATGTTDCAFELRWRRPEAGPPPIDILNALAQRFQIREFKLTTES
jgi:hypothetical protein